MKTRNIFTAITFIVLLAFVLPLDMLAQGKAKGGPPPWAPAHGYRAKTRHIYFSDHNFYYDVQKGVYIYMNNGKWSIAVKLPTTFAKVDLNKAVQVELELNTDSPQKYNADHKVKYKAKNKSNGSQVVVVKTEPVKVVKTPGPAKGKKK